ncbi:MAG TPA: hypothetical protein VH144_00750 [Candidatus Saccharimonadales bacterium]|jgi:heme O synthase-like polyprenyltransferase|nr:hypothetical protein [Candidatus Saccharimonadales bacterium]
MSREVPEQLQEEQLSLPDLIKTKATMISVAEWQETDYRQLRKKRVTQIIGATATGAFGLAGSGIALAEQAPILAGVAAVVSIASYATAVALGKKYNNERDVFYNEKRKRNL